MLGGRWAAVARVGKRQPAPKRPVASQGASPHPMHFERLQLAVRVHILLQSNQILVTLVQTTSVCGAPMQWRRSSYEYGPDTRGPDTRGPDTRGPDTRNSTDVIARGCGVTSIGSYHCIDAPPATDFHVGFLRATWARQSYISWFIIDRAEL